MDDGSPPQAMRRSSSSSPPPHFPLRHYLGDGPVADLMLWKRPHVSVSALIGATSIWFIFEQAGYSFLAHLTHVLLLLVLILFLWAKAANLLNRPLPPLPNFEISEEAVDKAADASSIFINRVLAVAHGIAIGKDAKLFLQVVLALWVVSYIGSLISFRTLLFIGVIFAFTIPAFYDKHQHLVDEKIHTAQSVFLPWCSKFDDAVISKFFMPQDKQKKIQ